MIYDSTLQVEAVLDRAKAISDAQKLGVDMGSAIQRGIRSQPLGKITGQASEFQKSLEASNARVVAFGASAGAIYAVKTAFEKLISSTIEVEKQLKNINLYLGVSSGTLKSFSSELFKVAVEASAPFEDAAKAAQEFSRQGLGMNEVLKRTRDTLNLVKLTGESVEESITNLTSIMNSFGKESLNTTMIVDRLSSVGSKFAVSADAIAEALKRVGSSANDAGVQFDDMVALITAAQHITGRSASVIGNSFKTMFTRLERPKVLDDLEAVGVGVRNTSGSVLPLIDILRNLSSKYETLSASQKSFVSETVGGVFQINTLKAVLNDLGGGFSIYGQAMDAAANSTGIAQKRVEQLNETISSQLQQNATIWKQTLSNIGNLTFSPFKNVVKSGFNLGSQIGEATDQKNGNTFLKGGLKGLGEFIGGPGLQLGLSLLLKIGTNLATFTYKAYKDTVALDSVEKQRVSTNNAILNLLGGQNKQVSQQLEGATTYEQKLKIITNELYAQIEALEKRNALANQITSDVEKGGGIGLTSQIGSLLFPQKQYAVGYIPEMTEKSMARAGGYSAGNVINTKIKDGSILKSVIANTAETISSVGNYQWINPPKNSYAGMIHAKKSMAATGINPYNLEQMALSGGFVPNLATLLGEGRFGEFWDLNKQIRGMNVGVKKFKPGSSHNVAIKSLFEKLMGSTLAATNKDFKKHGINFPYIFDENEISEAGIDVNPREHPIFKEIVKNKPLDSIVNSMISHRGLKRGHSRGSSIVFDAVAENLLEQTRPIISKISGINAEDLHSGNASTNFAGLKYLMNVGSIYGSNQPNLEDFKKKGGMLSIFDVGNFTKPDSHVPIIDWNMGGFSYGAIPNAIRRENMATGGFGDALGGIPNLSIINNLGKELSQKFNLIKSKKAYNQTQSNCYDIACELAKKHGFIPPTHAQASNNILENNAKKLGWGTSEENIYSSPKNSLGNIVVREGGNLDYHTSFEHKGKEYNFGPGKKEGYNIAARIALNRENMATGGFAKLSFSPLLKTSENPLGIAAIDGRNQSNADEAIKQHLLLGQSMGQIKNAHTAKGFVPNLDISDLGGGSSLFMMQMMLSTLAGGKAIMSTAPKSDDEVSAKINKFSNLLSAATRDQEKQLNSYQKLISQIDKTTDVFGNFTKTTVDTRTIEAKGQIATLNNPEEASGLKQVLNQDRDKLLQTIKEQADKSYSSGIKLSVAASFGGQMLAQLASSGNHPDLAKGLEKASTDFTLAGQAKMILPPKVGNMAVAGFGAMGIADIFKELKTGIGSKEANFEKSQDQFQKVSTSLDALAQSIANMDNYATDSSVTFEALTRESRKYQEALTNLSASGASQEQISKIRNAPDSKTKIKEIESLKSYLSDTQENKAVGLDVSKQLIEKRGKLFSYSGEYERDSQFGFLNNIAGRSVSNFTNEQKSGFEKSVLGGKNISFDDLLNSNAQTRTILGDIKDKISQDLIVKQVNYLIGQNAIEKNPEVVKKRNEAIEANQQANFPLEMAVRQREMLKQLFVNSSNLNTGNTIDIFRQKSQTGFSQQEIELSRREGDKTLEMTSGPMTIARYKQQLETEKAALATRQKLSESSSSFTTKLTSLLTPKEEIPSDVVKSENYGIPGQNYASIAPKTVELTQAFSTGLSKTLTDFKGDLTPFVKYGQVQDSLKTAILGNSGQKEGTPVYTMLSQKLDTLLEEPKILEEIKDHSNDLVNINREGNQLVQEAAGRFENAMKEYQMQLNSTFLGGIKAFETTGGSMGLMSQYKRDIALSGSSNPIVAGRGALKQLEWIKENSGLKGLELGKGTISSGANKGLYEEHSGNALNDKQAGLANTFLKGYYENEKRMISRMNPNDPLRQAMEKNLETQKYGIGKDALEQIIHPEKSDMNNTGSIDEASKEFSDGLKKSETELGYFGSSIDELVRKISALDLNIESKGGLRETVGKTIEKNNADVNDAINAASVNAPKAVKQGNELTGEKSDLPKSTFLDKAGNFANSLITPGIGIGTSLLGSYLGSGGRFKGLFSKKSGSEIKPNWESPGFEEIPIEKSYNSPIHINPSQLTKPHNSPIHINSSQLTSSTPKLINQLNEQQINKLKNSLDRPLHLTPKELDQPFTHGGTKFTPNQLKEMGVLDISGVIGEGQGQATGKHAVVFNNTIPKPKIISPKLLPLESESTHASRIQESIRNINPNYGVNVVPTSGKIYELPSGSVSEHETRQSGHEQKEAFESTSGALNAGRTTREIKSFETQKAFQARKEMERLQKLSPVKRPWLEKERIKKLGSGVGGTLMQMGLGGMAGSAFSESMGGNGTGGFIGGSFIENSIAKGGVIGEGGLGMAGGAGGVAAAGMFGWQAGMAINDKYIGSNERMGASAKNQRDWMLEQSPALKEQQRLAGSISNVKFQESQVFKNKNLSNTEKYEGFKTLEATIKALTAQMEEVKNKAKEAYKNEGENNNETGSSISVPISIDINIKDLDNAPDMIKEKLIQPLMSQIAEIQKRLNISPNPSKV